MYSLLITEIVTMYECVHEIHDDWKFFPKPNKFYIDRFIMLSSNTFVMMMVLDPLFCSDNHWTQERAEEDLIHEWGSEPLSLFTFLGACSMIYGFFDVLHIQSAFLCKDFVFIPSNDMVMLDSMVFDSILTTHFLILMKYVCSEHNASKLCLVLEKQLSVMIYLQNWWISLRISLGLCNF